MVIILFHVCLCHVVGFIFGTLVLYLFFIAGNYFHVFILWLLFYVQLIDAATFDRRGRVTSRGRIIE